MQYCEKQQQQQINKTLITHVNIVDVNYRIKLKRDYIEGYGICDSLDVVPIGELGRLMCYAD